MPLTIRIGIRHAESHLSDTWTARSESLIDLVVGLNIELQEGILRSKE